jgi:hypothetical protein
LTYLWVGAAYNSAYAIFNSSGVGIGVIPTSKLHVLGNGAQTRFDTGAATDARIEFLYNGSRNGGISIDSGLISLFADSGKDLHFNVVGSNLVRLNNSSSAIDGRGVHLGSYNTSGVSDYVSGMFFGYSGGTASANKSILFYTGGNNATPKMTIDGSGNLTAVGSTTTKIAIKGQVGGWAVEHSFTGSSGTALGGFGANGTSDALDVYYIGTNASRIVTAYNGKVLIGNTGANGVYPGRTLELAESTDNTAKLRIRGTSSLYWDIGPTYTYDIGELAFNASGTTRMYLRQDGKLDISTVRVGAIGVNPTNVSPWIYAFSGTANLTPVDGGLGLAFYSYQNSTANSHAFSFGGTTANQTSGSARHVYIARGFAPTSGTSTYDLLNLTPTINQTGGANGTTRGLYINPTITAAADFHGLEISNCGSHSAIVTGTGLVQFGDAVTASGVVTAQDSIRVGTAVTNAPQMFTFSGATHTSQSVSGRGLTLYSKTATAGDTSFAFSGDSMLPTSGTSTHLLIQRSLAPTSGTGSIDFVKIQPTINQTGGANGVTRSLYVVPTLTSAADHRSIEIADVGASHFAIKTGTGKVQFGDNVQPATTNTATNGISSLRWSNVYSVLGNFSGIVTAQTEVVLGTNASPPRVFSYNGNLTTTQDSAGQSLGFYTWNQSTVGHGFAFSGQALQQTTGSNSNLIISRNISPTSGSGTFAVAWINTTVNQTGGANGITRGLYILPTLTAAADFRGIEVSNCGSHKAIVTGTGPVNFGDYVTTVGALGVGTGSTAPGARCEISHTTSQMLRLNNPSTAADGVGGRLDGYNVIDYISGIFMGFSGGTALANRSILFYSGGDSATPKMTLDGSGNITATGTAIRINSASTGSIGTTQAQTFQFVTNASTRGHITSLGRWVIGNFVDTSSSSITAAVTINPTYNQTGTAGSTDLLVNRTDTALGSGTHLFADFQLAGVTKLSFTRSGGASFGGNLVFPGTAITRTIQIGDTYNDGSVLQVLNGATVIGQFNATTGFTSNLNIVASGTIRSNSIIGGFGFYNNPSTWTTNDVGFLFSSSHSGSGNILPFDGAAISSGNVISRIKNNGTGSALQYIWAAGAGDSHTNWLNGTVEWSAGVDQSDSNAWKLNFGANPSSGTNVLKVTTAGVVTFTGTITPQKATTAGAPAWVNGAMYFDTTLNKLRIGGAAGWETVTSV